MRPKFAITFLMIFCFTICMAMPFADLAGKWVGHVETANGSVAINYTFVVDGQKLTGTVEGPQGTVDIQNGTFKDSLLSFDIMNGSNLHMAGKYYGDSVVMDFATRSGMNVHLPLTKSK